MGSRIERNKRMERYRQRKINQLLNLLKFNIILFVFVFMIYSLFIVNNTIIDLNCLDNPNLLSIDIVNSEIIFLGKSYNLNLEVFKK